VEGDRLRHKEGQRTDLEGIPDRMQRDSSMPRRTFFDQLKDQFKVVRDKKQALLDEAVSLKDSTEWRQTADRLKHLQQQWKEAGSAGPSATRTGCGTSSARPAMDSSKRARPPLKSWMRNKP
jgi:hypothetical protein